MENYVTLCTSLDGPDALQYVMQDVQPPNATELTVAVKAASLNFPDLLMTHGKYQFKPTLPFVIGMEGAGVVDAVGSDVSRFSIGDKVIFRGKTGACSRFVTVDKSNTLSAPQHLTFEEAAAFGVTFQTAYVSLVRRGRISAQDTVLILGAGGGVGQASVSVAKTLGATVIAAASSDEKLEIAKRSGADHLVNYSQSDLVNSVNTLTEGRGVDLVLDPVGGDLLHQSTECLTFGGRLLVVGFAGGEIAQVNVGTIQSKGISIVGVRAGEYGRRSPRDGVTAWQELKELAEKKELRPFIGKTWLEDQVREALKAMAGRQVSGKQLIRISAT